MPARQPINTPLPTPAPKRGFFAWLSNLFRPKPKKDDWLNTINQNNRPKDTASDDFMRMNNVDGGNVG